MAQSGPQEEVTLLKSPENKYHRAGSFVPGTTAAAAVDIFQFLFSSIAIILSTSTHQAAVRRPPGGTPCPITMRKQNTKNYVKRFAVTHDAVLHLPGIVPYQSIDNKSFQVLSSYLISLQLYSTSTRSRSRITKKKKCSDYKICYLPTACRLRLAAAARCTWHPMQQNNVFPQ